jgi:uncharacterized protein (TIGR02300 family)
VVSDELGTKRTCPSCGARFYDLQKTPIVCPKCDTNFVAEAVLPSKADGPAPRHKAAPKAVEKEEVDDIEDNDTLVSLEDLDDDADDADDDETAGIEDVELDDDDDDDTADVFLDDDEEEGDAGVGDLIGGGKPGEDEV